jgi:catechol 2,3-dioxygenase-like lactoylglutathione lyase family enzyme
MKLWTGIVTARLAESRDFYVRLFGCEVVFDSDWFVLLRLGETELAFLAPDLPQQAPPFRGAYPGQGVWVAVEVADVDAEYRRLQALEVPMELSLRDEPWGDRHFVILDPNGIGVDIVRQR